MIEFFIVAAILTLSDFSDLFKEKRLKVCIIYALFMLIVSVGALIYFPNQDSSFTESILTLFGMKR